MPLPHIHAVTEVNESERTGTCSRCGAVRVKRKKQNPGTRDSWRCMNKVREEAHKEVAAIHGLTYQEYQEMYDAQQGRCAICGGLCSTGKRLAVDHNHETGVVRGLLCNHCNRALGFFRDDPLLLQSALEYLAAHA